MLDLLRKRAQSPLIQGTILIIALVFIFWGVGSGYRGTRNSVAMVNDEAISVEQFNKTYEQLANQYRTQFGGTIPKGLLDSLDLEGQALEQLIQRTLLRQGAREMGIIISDLEVKKAVEEMEAFRVDGIFNVEQYRVLLNSTGTTPTAFEESMRTDLLSGKVIEYLSRFAKLTPLEISEQFNFENEEINIEYISFSAEDFKDRVKVTDEALETYYEKNKDNYLTAPQIKLNFIPFLRTAEADVSAEEIESFYRQNFNRYSIPEQRSARHILIKTAETDSEDILSEKLKRAEQVLELARSGEDFGELAKQYSEGPSGPNGGNLGSFTRGRMVKPFDDAVFSMNEGEISDIVETQFGFHIIKLEKIDEARTRSLEEVMGEITSIIQEQKGSQLSFSKASQAYENIILAGSLEKFSQQHSDIKVEETEFFPKNAPEKSGFTEGILHNPAFLDAAFALNKGELSSLVETADGYAIIYTADKKAPEITPLEKVRDQVQQDYVRAEAEAMARSSAESLLAALKEEGGEFAAEAEKYGKSVEDSGVITRRSPAGSLPLDVATAGFDLTAESPYPEEIIASNGNYYVFRVVEKKQPSVGLLTEKEAEFKAKLLEAKKNSILASWLANVREKAEIQINEQFL